MKVGTVARQRPRSPARELARIRFVREQVPPVQPGAPPRPQRIVPRIAVESEVAERGVPARVDDVPAELGPSDPDLRRSCRPEPGPAEGRRRDRDRRAGARVEAEPRDGRAQLVERRPTDRRRQRVSAVAIVVEIDQPLVRARPHRVARGQRPRHLSKKAATPPFGAPVIDRNGRRDSKVESDRDELGHRPSAGFPARDRTPDCLPRSAGSTAPGAAPPAAPALPVASAHRGVPGQQRRGRIR